MRAPLTIPLVVTSPFGQRPNPWTKELEQHLGADYRAPVGTPCVAILPGTVQKVWTDSENGLALALVHSDPLVKRTTYSHLSEYAPGLREGQRVGEGAYLAKSGATGKVTGAHLHFHLEDSRGPIDPEPILAGAPFNPPLQVAGVKGTVWGVVAAVVAVGVLLAYMKGASHG